MNTIIFGQRYSRCPRQPEGYKWQASMRSRYGSSSWGFNSFAEALSYLRGQYAHAVAETKARRRAGDEYCEREFWGFIEGPGGMMSWLTIAALVRGVEP